MTSKSQNQLLESPELSLEKLCEMKGCALQRRRRGLCVLLQGDEIIYKGSQDQCFDFLRSNYITREPKTPSKRGLSAGFTPGSHLKPKQKRFKKHHGGRTP